MPHALTWNIGTTGRIASLDDAPIASGNAEFLKSLLTDDYVHVHISGLVDNREGHLKAVAARPRTPVRGDLLVRIFGDVAVITGTQDNHSGAPNNEIVHGYGHQVAVKQGGQWRFVSFQLTHIA